jgi:hypothetical protein
LPSFSRTLPLRTELAITETTENLFKRPMDGELAGGYSSQMAKAARPRRVGQGKCRPIANLLEERHFSVGRATVK